MPFFCISEPPTPGSALRLNADVLVVSDRMDPPTALSWMLLEPFDTSLETEMPVRTRSLRATRRVCGGRTRLTPEPGTFPPAVSCARAARSQQASSCTAGPRGQLGSPALGEIFFSNKVPRAHQLSCCRTALLPTPSLWSSCRSLAPPGGALGSAVHWTRVVCWRPPQATWAAAGQRLLSGSGWQVQAVRLGPPPPSAARGSSWQPVSGRK